MYFIVRGVKIWMEESEAKDSSLEDDILIYRSPV